MFKVYILRNTKGIYYKGFTTDLSKRIEQHNADKSRFTAGKGPWELVYVKEFATKSEALIEEKRIKRLNGASLNSLINS